MANIKSTLSLVDKFSPVLKRIAGSTDATTAAMRNMDKVSNQAFSKAQKDARKTADGMKQLKKQNDETKRSFNNMGANLGGTIYAIKSIADGLGNVALKLDDINSRAARANMLAGQYEGTSGEEIRGMVQQAALNSRGNYSTMMSSVGKMGIMAKDAFANPQELVAFNEQLQKTFVIAGAGGAQIDSAMLQITQAMASGLLRGEEFNAVFEAAPNIIQRIAEYTGKSTGEMRKMASEGLLTADVVKNAMLAAAEETNTQFEQMPMTFQAVKNMIMMDMENMLQPVAESFSKMWKSVVDNWDTIRPILGGVAAALGSLAIAFGVVTAAQWAWNFAQAASPTTWIVLGIAALIGIIVGLTMWITNLWKTNMDFKYGVIKIWNDILGFFDKVPIFFQWVGGGIADAFGYAKVSVLENMEAMANGAIDIINKLIDKVNAIPGVAIDPIDHVSFAAQAGIDEAAKRTERANKLAEMEKSAAQNAWARGLLAAQNRKADEASIAASSAATQNAATQNAAVSYDDLANKGVTVKGGKLDDVSISEDDIELLKDVASAGFMAQYTKLQPNLKVEFSGPINSTVDTNELLDAIEIMVEEAYASSLVGEGA